MIHHKDCKEMMNGDNGFKNGKNVNVLKSTTGYFCV